MLELFDVVKKRSIHYFTKEKISDEDLRYILEVARWAPSAGNRQPWRSIVVAQQAPRALALRQLSF